MKQYILAAVAALAGAFGASAQIGYQVAVVDRTTGEPKVNIGQRNGNNHRQRRG